MKRLTVAVVLTAALALAPASLASGGLTGKYKSVQSGGTWVLKFASGGTFKGFNNGQLAVSGTDTVSGSHITFKDGSAVCAGKAGKYTFTKTATKQTFTKVSDPCTQRAHVLVHTWTKIS
jgi:hypothetical protein